MASARSRRWVDRDPISGTVPARAAFRRRFEDQVDPDRLLTDEQRAELVREALRVHFRALGMLSGRARRAAAKAQS